ncbi:MAG: prepilin-type N-terminal cleavage/methylation domain-containing protein [Acidobacteriota bacterium]
MPRARPAAEKGQEKPIPPPGAVIASSWTMQRGFSLVEVVVAMGITTTAALAVAQLSIMSVRANRVARSTTSATVLALQKLEQLQSAEWTELIASPPEVLGRNTGGFFDVLDANGGTLAAETAAPAGAVFVRRWSLDLLSSGDALVIQVVVAPVGRATSSVVGRGPEEARLVAIKTR